MFTETFIEYLEEFIGGAVKDGQGKKMLRNSEVMHSTSSGTGIVKRINNNGSVNVRWNSTKSVTTMNPYELIVLNLK